MSSRHVDMEPPPAAQRSRLEHWARHLIACGQPEQKLAITAPSRPAPAPGPEQPVEGDPAPPSASSTNRSPADVPCADRQPPSSPGRCGFRLVTRARRMPKELTCREARCQVLHTLAHHELQALELMAWALLAFPETPAAFQWGLARIMGDEARHLRLYDARLRQLGSHYGALPVRDWFWERVPSCRSPRQFVACLGLGFEGGNLDHSPELIARFEAAGDTASAEVQRRVAREEVGHVRFAVHWFGVWSQACSSLTRQEVPPPTALSKLTFQEWKASLPPPLTPLTMHRLPLARGDRAAAGLDARFLDEFEAWARSLRRGAPAPKAVDRAPAARAPTARTGRES